jgi:hypothetical protein
MKNKIGIKTELKGVIIVGLLCVLTIVPALLLSLDVTFGHLVIDLSFFVIWCITIMYPLWLARRHRLKQYELARQVAGVESLAELLTIPEGATAFGTFCLTEFTYDSYSFYMKVMSFRKTFEKLIVTPSTAKSSHQSIVDREKHSTELPVVSALRNVRSIYELFIVADRYHTMSSLISQT